MLKLLTKRPNHSLEIKGTWIYLEDYLGPLMGLGFHEGSKEKKRVHSLKRGWRLGERKKEKKREKKGNLREERREHHSHQEIHIGFATDLPRRNLLHFSSNTHIERSIFHPPWWDFRDRSGASCKGEWRTNPLVKQIGGTHLGIINLSLYIIYIVLLEK